MRARLVLAAALLGSGCMAPDDVSGRVSWVEARWLPTGLDLHVLGTTGCGRLNGMAVHVAWRVDSSAVFVALDARATAAGTACQPANGFDTAFVVNVPRPPRQAIAFVTAAERSHILADSRDTSVARWFGGRADVAAAPPMCPYLQLTRGYAIDPVPGTTLDQGARLFVRGALPVAPASGCGGEPRGRLTYVEVVPLSVP